MKYVNYAIFGLTLLLNIVLSAMSLWTDEYSEQYFHAAVATWVIMGIMGIADLYFTWVKGYNISEDTLWLKNDSHSFTEFVNDVFKSIFDGTFSAALTVVGIPIVVYIVSYIISAILWLIYTVLVAIFATNINVAVAAISIIVLSVMSFLIRKRNLGKLRIYAEISDTDIPKKRPI
jgi:hypothetical protein